MSHRKLASVRKIEGNPGRRPISEDFAEVVPEMPKAPHNLDGYAVTYWNQTVLQLHKMGILGEIDQSGLASICETYCRWIDESQSLKKEGTIVEGETGAMYMNPRFRVVMTLQENLRKLLIEFGMTPLSRARAKKPTNDKRQQSKSEEKKSRFFSD